MFSLDFLYQPIATELRSTEEGLLALSRGAKPPMDKMLSYIPGLGGKRIRPAITLLTGKLFQPEPHLLIPMAQAVELLHTATLVHDDTIDNALTRRGRATVNSQWNRSTAILIGDYLFATSARLVASTKNQRVIELFAQTLVDISSAELTQLFPDYEGGGLREQYFSRIGGKTASLFASAAESGARLSHAPEEGARTAGEYGYNLGMAFQIVDDILDLVGTEEEVGKPVGNDLLQGVLTLPAILAVETAPADNPVKRFLAGRNREDLPHILDLIRSSSAIRKSSDVAGEFCARALRALKSLPPSPCRDSLEALTAFVLERKR